MNEMSINKNIAALRKEAGLTQEALASKLGISYQAVSKWENGLSCPDLQLLPKIAEIFSVSIDSLFGAEPPKPAAETGESTVIISGLPWEDDEDFHIVLYKGHELISEERRLPDKALKELNFIWDGPALNVSSRISMTVKGDVQGSAAAGGNLVCDNIDGDAKAGGNISCDEISGNAAAGGGINCDHIYGSAKAGGRIVCDHIMGDDTPGKDFHGIHGSFTLDKDDMSPEQQKKYEKIIKKAESLEDSGLDLADRIVSGVDKMLKGLFK